MNEVLSQTTQLKHWYMGGQDIDFTQSSGTTYVSTNLPATIGLDYATNGVYDANGDIIFYVNRTTIFDKYGNNKGSFPCVGGQVTECSIVPVPGNCFQYYVIYTVIAAHNTNTAYIIYGLVDISSGTPILPSSSSTFNDLSYSAVAPSAYGIGFAVSNIINFKGERFLYLVVGTEFTSIPHKGKVIRYRITNSGIVYENEIMDVSTMNLDYSTREVDLSPDGTKLAWGSWRKKNSIYIVTLEPCFGSYVSHNEYTTSSYGIATGSANSHGVEFSPNNNKLFYSDYTGYNNNIIKYIDLLYNSIHTVVGAQSQEAGQLELAADGYIYFPRLSNLDCKSINPTTLNVGDKTISMSGLSCCNAFGLLPDQIDGYNYDYLERLKTCCPEEYTYDVPIGIGVSTSATWTHSSNPFIIGTNDISMAQGFEVGPGTEIIIEHMEFRFGPYAKVVVHPGGRLILKGTTFKGLPDCNSMWKGIEVWGDRNESQDSYQTNGMRVQGQIIVKDYDMIPSTISNAFTAIQAIKVNCDGSLDWSKTGGIIQVQDQSNFTNNRAGIWIGGYKNFKPGFYGIKSKQRPNRSSITNCNFITNDLFYGDMNFHWFVGLYDGSGINITKNTFQNNTTSTTYLNKGIGIISINFPMNVVALCASTADPCPVNDIQPNVFSGLNYGINYYSSLGSSPFTNINYNTFTNCYRGITLNNSYNTKVIYNDIEVPEWDQQMFWPPYGIYINEGNAFKITKNNISASGNYFATRGIIANKTGNNTNEIYQNYFTGLNVGIESQFNNKTNNYFVNVGLFLLCNEFNNPYYDIIALGKTEVLAQNPSANTYNIGLAQQQLRSNFNTSSPNLYLPADNEFSSLHTTSSDYDFSNIDANSIEYYYDPTGGSELYPDKYSWLVLDNSLINDNSTRCPSKISNGGNIAQQYASLSTARVAFNSSKLIRDIWKDGGIEDLGEEVETTLPWDAYQQFNDLMSESPYLSEEVLIAFVENPVFTSLMVKLLMVANPHSARSDLVMQAIYDRIPALPQSYIDDILNAEGLDSPLEELEGNVSADFHNVRIIEEEIIGLYANDTINDWAEDSLKDFVSRRPGLTDRYQLASIYLDYGQFTDMQSVLNNIPSEFELSEDETTNYQNNLIIFAMAADIAQNNKVPGSLNQTQLTNLETIMQSDYLVDKAMALSLLKWNNPDYVYEQTILEPIVTSARKRNPNNRQREEEKTIMKVFPNPAKDYFTIEYRTVDRMYENLELVIQDASGRKIIQKRLKGGDYEELIDLSNFISGIYSVLLYADNKILSANKLTIMK